MGQIIQLLDTKCTEPQLYGIYHVSALVVIALVTFLMCRFVKSPSEKTVRKILLITSVTVIVFEIYKQFNYSFSYVDGKVVYDYQWYAFPFQFCSTPMYIGLLAALIKNQRVHKALCAYLCTFALFAGTAVMIYPGDVFISTVGINIQTVVCHGSMVIIGIFLLYTNYVRSELKTLYYAIPVFAITLSIACILNEIAYFSGLLETEDFNMFFISPHGEPSLPVLSLIQPHLPFVFDMVVYIVGFSIAAGVMLLISMGIKRIRAS